MQRLGDDSWVVSASDLTALSQCPWRVARVVDQKLGKDVIVPDVDDPMMDLVARLGLEHEARQWALLKDGLPRVQEISYERDVDPQDASAWRSHIEAARAATVAAMESGVDAIFQGVFFQDSIPGAPFLVGFQGFADFVVASDRGWEVWDTKLARSAKDSALIQLASYVDQLDHLGIARSPDIRLILGDGTHSIHDVTDVIPLYLDYRRTLLGLMHERIEDPEPTPWGDPRYVACGTKGCPACSEQILLHDDLFQIAGLRKTQREKIRVAGYSTMTAFAQASRSEVRSSIHGINRDTLALLHLQASLQVATRTHPEGRPAWEVMSASMLDRIPEPDPGDVFFDFEGDPTYQEFDEQGEPLGALSTGDESVWFGIEYLFGMWGDALPGAQPGEKFVGLWAETFEEEKQALEQFCALMEQRLIDHPAMHIYHYASYERTRLATMAARHNTCQSRVDRLLDGVLIDLYPIVMKGVRIGLPSYSLKALEALYFERDTRTGIAGGGESVVAFSDYMIAKRHGLFDEATQLRESIIHYNRIDCFSTEALRDWLRSIRSDSARPV
jgi:predicted RecB family nuclease